VCLCDCGKTTTVLEKSLKLGLTRSCGCFFVEKRKAGCNWKHGEAIVGKLTKEYRTWRNVVVRTTDTRSKSFENYGGRGITICASWLKSFSNFLSDMGRCPRGKSLERKDNNGPYSPENCVWASPLVQANNTRRNRWVTIKGIRKTVAQWARIAGVSPNNIYARLKRGLDGLNAVADGEW
jgi:hypothetical protein